jgi:hypothetical protein
MPALPRQLVQWIGLWSSLLRLCTFANHSETRTLANIYSPWIQSVGLLRVGLILCIYLQTNLLLIVVHVDGVRSCRWTAASNEPIVHPRGIYESGEPWWNGIDRGKRRSRRKDCPSATLPTTNATQTEPGENPGLRGEQPATNHLSHGTASYWVKTTFEDHII